MPCQHTQHCGDDTLCLRARLLAGSYNWNSTGQAVLTYAIALRAVAVSAHSLWGISTTRRVLAVTWTTVATLEA
jgi:hypothetical protein